MPKLTANDLKELFDIVADIKPVRLEFCISAAERTLRGWVTNPVYEANAPTAQVEALKFAEANLAVYHVLLNTGARIRRSGLVKKEQDAGGSVTNSVTSEFYSPDEIIKLRGQFYKEADDAAQIYLPAAVTAKRVGSSSAIMRGGWAE